MRVQCSKCQATYDDTYRDTGCPHDTFKMHTMVVNSNDATVYVVVSLTDLDAVQLHGTGTDSRAFDRIKATEHIHGPDNICLSRDRSGYLVEAT